MGLDLWTWPITCSSHHSGNRLINTEEKEGSSLPLRESRRRDGKSIFLPSFSFFNSYNNLFPDRIELLYLGQIRFVLLQNRQGKTRLAKYYVPLEDSEKHKVEFEVCVFLLSVFSLFHFFFDRKFEIFFVGRFIG